MRFRIFTEPQEGATYDDQLAVARLAEELGFDAYFRSDHYISFFPGGGLPGPTDAWTTLAGLARDTTRLRLGTLVSPVTFRLPGPLAIAAAQGDAMSGGPVELRLGAGGEHPGPAGPRPRVAPDQHRQHRRVRRRRSRGGAPGRRHRARRRDRAARAPGRDPVGGDRPHRRVPRRRGRDRLLPGARPPRPRPPAAAGGG